MRWRRFLCYPLVLFGLLAPLYTTLLALLLDAINIILSLPTTKKCSQAAVEWGTFFYCVSTLKLLELHAHTS